MKATKVSAASLQMTLAQCTTAIENSGNESVLVQGQPGVGKSQMLKTLKERMPDYHVSYIDVANLDLGDIAMPVIDREEMVTHYAPSARFGIGKGQDRPVIMMLDELGKASRPVMNMLLPVILERRIGDVALPTGSIVFATTNLATDGVGDNIPAHAYNRMTVIDVANPTSEEWLLWAANNEISPEVMMFAREFPQVFDRYDSLSDNEKNPYIFNPLGGNTRAFCSPRSLARASHWIKNRNIVGSSLLSLLAGTVGEAAARDMESMVALGDDLPRRETVMTDPTKAKLPGSVAAYFLMAFSLATSAEENTLDAIMKYVERWTSFEARTVFITTLAGNKSKVAMACRNREFTKACAAAGKFF